MMKRIARIACACLIAMPLCAAAVGTIGSRPPPMTCTTGPVTRTYGKTQWLVYSCQDFKSIVVVSAPGSPAAPFYFRGNVKADGSYQFDGAGTGSKSATDAAYAELKLLSPKDIAALVSATRGVPASATTR
jgi:hypothetical protein